MLVGNVPQAGAALVGVVVGDERVGSPSTELGWS